MAEGQVLTGIVLAGGLSRRMGRDKASLPWDGEDLLHTALRALAPVCDALVVVSNQPRAITLAGVVVVADDYEGCGPLGGIHAGLTAASGDSRIKAVATASMYDMSRSMSRSYKDGYTLEQRHKVVDFLSRQRWADAEKGTYALGYHEVPFDQNGQIVKGNRVLPQELPADADPVLTAFFNYYRTPRGYHARSINSASAWTATTPMSFFQFPMAANIDMIAPRPIMLVHGANAHSRYYSEDVHKAAPGPMELVIVPDADHVDLYDNLNKIPFDRLEAFFKQSLA